MVPSGTPLDLTTHGAVGEANGAIFRQFDAQPTGTGVINSFVRLQAPNAKVSVQQGYNTAHRPLQFDENKSPQFTRALHLSEVPTVNIGGVVYREFLLDINQKASQPLLSLDELRFYVGAAGDLSGYDPATHQLAGLNAVYDLDAVGDNYVKLDARLNQGSGKGDMLAYVPDSVFAAAPGSDPFVYLYSKFGVTFTANAGFEEWAAGKGDALTPALGLISGTVYENGLPKSDVIVFLDADHDGLLDNNEAWTYTDVKGNYAFGELATGMGALTTYWVSVLPPAGDTVTAVPPSGTTATPNQEIIVSLDQSGEQVYHVDFLLTSQPPPPPGPSTGGGGGGPVVVS